MVDSVSVRFKNARIKKMPLNIRIQWNAGIACVSECVLKKLACRGLRVGPSKGSPRTSEKSLQKRSHPKAFGLRLSYPNLELQHKNICP